MGTPSRAEAAAIRPSPWPTLLGYNAPFALWTAYALGKPLLAAADGAGGGAGDGLWCPTHALLGWCPTCGMTGEYTALLYTGQLPGPWTLAILAAFAAMALWSVHRCCRS